MRDGFRSATQAFSDKIKSRCTQKTEKIKIGDVSILRITPKTTQEPSKDFLLFYIHGGAFTLGSPDHLYQNFAPIAQDMNVISYAIDYRLAPEHPYPASLNDCVNVFEALSKNNPEKRIFVLGDSAGATLALSMTAKLREQKKQLPVGIALLSPCGDLKMDGDSWHTFKGISPKLTRALVIPSLEAYIPKGKDYQDPYISPAYLDFKHFPPVLITTGTRDGLLSDVSLIQEALIRDKVEHHLLLQEAMWHGIVEHDFPEAQKLRDYVADFFSRLMQRQDSRKGKASL